MFRKQKVLNTEKICLLILLVLTISIVALPTASAADEYNADDVAAFREIIDQLDRWSPILDKNDISTWANYVTWSDEPSNKRIIKLEIAHGGLTGDLDVTGLPELRELYCHNNSLSSLDVSKNIKLTHLNCYNNKITSLDVTGNPELTYLNCDMLDLKTLDVTKNTKLTELRCDDTNLTDLDVTQNTELTILSCYRNSLTSLDVTKNTKLTRLYCEYNSLMSLDLTENTELADLRANNQNIILSDVTAFGNQLTISSPIKYNGNQIADANINVAGSGSVNNGDITWTGLSGENGNSVFSFTQSTEYGVFSGTVTQPWTAGVPTDKYTVAFNSDGGTSVQSQAVDSGDLVTQPVNPEKAGYIFVEWQLNGVAYDFSAPVTSDLTLVAVYRVVTSATHTVTFNFDGGIMYGNPSRVKVNDGNLVTKPSGDPFKFHYNFIEWRLNGTAYDFSTPVTSDLTLVAFYEPIHTVTFNTSGTGTFVPSKKVDNGSLVTKPANPIKINSNFIEWQLNGVTYDFSTPVTSNITLVAVYEPIHKVTFNTNGGIGYVPPKKVNNGSLVTKPSDPFKFNGAFVEWQLNGVAYDFSTPVTSNITLVAVYK